MERAGVYRRALAPMTSVAGVIGVTGGVISDWVPYFNESRAYVLFWALISLIAGGSGLYLSRRQAWKDQEAFWSPPARRVTQAFLPSVAMGIFIAVWAWHSGQASRDWMRWIPCLWMGVYGMGLNAAGFFMPRGIRLLGWFFICGALCLGFWNLFVAGGKGSAPVEWRTLHWLMAGVFGGGHLLYGIYLNLTETYRSNYES